MVHARVTACMSAHYMMRRQDTWELCNQSTHSASTAGAGQRTFHVAADSEGQID
jgi:hypothetical protein